MNSGRRLPGLWMLLALTVFGAACRSRDTERSVPLVAARPEPARPKELVAELVVAHPAKTWADFKPLFGPVATLLPKNPELALANVLGLSPLAASGIDLTVPLVGGVDAQGTGLVIAVRLTSGPELVASLTTGTAPSHRVKREGELSMLLSASPEQSGPAMAVLDNTLLVGHAEKLASFGPYLTRSLARKAAPSKPLVLSAGGDALAASVVPQLRKTWAVYRKVLDDKRLLAERAQGRAADFADPSAVLAGVDESVQAFLEVFASARDLRLEITPEPDRLLMDLALWPRADGAAKQFSNGLADVPLALLRNFPETAPVGLLLGRSLPVESSGWLDGMTRLFGERISDADLRAARDALVLLDTGCGRAQVFGASLPGELIWMGEVADRQKLEDGVRGALALLRRKPFSSPLAELFGVPQVRFGDRNAPNQPKAHFAVIDFMPSAEQRKAGMQERSVELLWAVDESHFKLVLAPDADPIFESLLAASKTPTSPASSGAELLRDVSGASLAGVLDLGAIGASDSRTAERAPVAFALSRESDHLRVRLVAAPRGLQLLTEQAVR